MFALEISFQDGVSQPEMVLVRRPQALIGASDYAHVVIDDMASLDYQLRVIKDLGRQFRVKPVGVQEGANIPHQLEGVYNGFTVIDTGVVKIRVHSLDGDLTLRDNEPPDRAGVRVLRQACALKTPTFPAIVVRGADPMVISFAPDQVIYVGRSNQCLIRLDTSDISAKHARIGFESGEFWIEDLGSTNGTFVDGQQISGRTTVKPGIPVILGRQVSMLGVTSGDELRGASTIDSTSIKRPSSRRYPVLMSVSEIARPARVVLSIGETLVIGRDPASDMWLGAPHISRKHCDVTLTKNGEVVVGDHSTNGTFYGYGTLHNGEQLALAGRPHVFNFGGDITVAVCFDEEQEQLFAESSGDPAIFLQDSEMVPKDDAVDEVEGTQVIGGSLTGSMTGISDTIIGTTGTVAFKNLVLHLTWPAKIMLGFGIAGGIILLWAVCSLLLTL